jgi:hypothetical protein
LNFDADGNILKLVQTKSGPPSVGPAPKPNPNIVKYEAETGAVTNGATVAEDASASGGKCIQNLNLTDSFVEISNVDGGASGGLNEMDIHFASAEDGKLHLTVNGEDYSYLNTFATGGWSAFTGDSSLTIPLQPGKSNVIRLTGGHGGVNVDYVTFTPLEQIN